jgi:hypothetical protein
MSTAWTNDASAYCAGVQGASETYVGPALVAVEDAWVQRDHGESLREPVHRAGDGRVAPVQIWA